MMSSMGRLVAGVREAEERLAGLARALQSLYEEEVREATLARDAAARSLARAQAMEQASLALGGEELTKRLSEVIEQLRGAYTTAMKRLEELAGIEKAVQMRLNEPVTPPPARTLPPPFPINPTIEVVEVSMEEATPAPAATLPPPSPRPPVPTPEEAKDDDLLAKQKLLLTRIEEIERAAARWQKEFARLAIQEHVALARLMVKRFKDAGRESEDLVSAAIAQLKALAEQLKLGKIVGFEASDVGEWTKLAATARMARTQLIEARRTAATKPA